MSLGRSNGSFFFTNVNLDGMEEFFSIERYIPPLNVL